MWVTHLYLRRGGKGCPACLICRDEAAILRAAEGPFSPCRASDKRRLRSALFTTAAATEVVKTDVTLRHRFPADIDATSLSLSGGDQNEVELTDAGSRRPQQ